MNHVRQFGPGILLCFAIAVPAWGLGAMFPVVGSPVFGILFGMLLALAFPNLPAAKNGTFSVGEGVKYTSKKILQYSVILLGFGMNLFHVLRVGAQSLSVIVFTLAASFITAYLVGRMLKLDARTTTLIGVGTSICGGSAIAATAPVIGAKDEEVAHAISTIFLFNIIAVFIFPAVGMLLGLSDKGFGMWAGTAINDTSSVVAAGAAWSNAVHDNTALAFATIVKLTRTLMIVPITLALAVYTAHKARRTHGSGGSAQYSVAKVFPWFVIWFVVAAVVNTFCAIPALSQALVSLGKFMIVMAMAAIGLNTNLLKLIANGVRPIFLGVCCWAAVAVVSLAVQQLTGMW